MSEEQTSDDRRLTKMHSWRTVWRSLLTKFFADETFLLCSVVFWLLECVVKKMGNSGKLLRKNKGNLRSYWWCLPNTSGAKVWPNNIETRFSSERIIKTRKIKRTKNSSCEPYAHFNTPKCPSATLEIPDHFLATTRTLQCSVSLASSAIEAMSRHRRLKSQRSLR